MVSSSLLDCGSITDVNHWRITLAWDGAPFLGWQRQPQGMTVQQAVEEALYRILGGVKVNVTASGRTDSGVHALAQVASFRTDVVRTERAIQLGLNANLPPEVVCLSATLAPEGFHARTWTRKKLYRYRILARQCRDPHRTGHVWHVRQPLDVAAMQEACSVLAGTHDFSSFRAAGCTVSSPVRTLPSAAVVTTDDEIHFEFIGHGFLRHQVRIMVGTLVKIGLGQWPKEKMGLILDARKRIEAGPTAPPHGLWLVWVETGDGPNVHGSS